MNRGLDIFDQCYEANSHAEIDNQALRLEIGRIKSKINNLVELCTEGDITKEDYRMKRDKLNQQLNAIEKKLEEARVTKEVKPWIWMLHLKDRSELGRDSIHTL